MTDIGVGCQKQSYGRVFINIKFRLLEFPYNVNRMKKKMLLCAILRANQDIMVTDLFVGHNVLLRKQIARHYAQILSMNARHLLKILSQMSSE